MIIHIRTQVSQFHLVGISELQYKMRIISDSKLFFCLEDGSADFDEFLSILGESIRIKGWERYRGGLDIKGRIFLKSSI